MGLLGGFNFNKAMIAAMLLQSGGHDPIRMIKEGKHDYDNYI